MASQSDLYQSVTDRIIAALEAGTAPWVKPWRNDGSGGALPHNAVTRRGYHGINVALLWMEEHARGYSSPQWLTFKQAADAGGHVRKGEKGTQIVFWQFRALKDRETGEDRRVPMLKTYYVFNVAQCEDVELPSAKPRPVIGPTEIDALIAKTGADITHGGDRACYIPSRDAINMPNRAAFRSLEHYHGTLLHELTHWTAHAERCARDLSGRFGSQAYAAEELIAEMGSAFLCARLGVPHEQLQHADYLANWLQVLRDDNRAIFTAAKAAQTAADYVLQACGLDAKPEADDDAEQLQEAA
jgi:antirestriction protein ArdC